jgi:hypothetical protein
MGANRDARDAWTEGVVDEDRRVWTHWSRQQTLIYQ